MATQVDLNVNTSRKGCQQVHLTFSIATTASAADFVSTHTFSRPFAATPRIIGAPVVVANQSIKTAPTVTAVSATAITVGWKSAGASELPAATLEVQVVVEGLYAL